MYFIVQLAIKSKFICNFSFWLICYILKRAYAIIFMVCKQCLWAYQGNVISDIYVPVSHVEAWKNCFTLTCILKSAVIFFPICVNSNQTNCHRNLKCHKQIKFHVIHMHIGFQVTVTCVLNLVAIFLCICQQQLPCLSHNLGISLKGISLCCICAYHTLFKNSYILQIKITSGLMDLF